MACVTGRGSGEQATPMREEISLKRAIDDIVDNAVESVGKTDEEDGTRKYGVMLVGTMHRQRVYSALMRKNPQLVVVCTGKTKAKKYGDRYYQVDLDHYFASIKARLIEKR